MTGHFSAALHTKQTDNAVHNSPLHCTGRNSGLGFLSDWPVWTWGYNKGLDGPLLGGSQVSKARPGAPFFVFLYVFLILILFRPYGTGPARALKGRSNP
jgi:hypothetical protein